MPKRKFVKPRSEYDRAHGIYRNANGKFTKRGYYYRSLGVSRKKTRKRKRKVAPPVGWSKISEWRGHLESQYPKLIYSEAIPAFLKFVYPKGSSFFLGKTKRLPHEGDIFRIVSIWIIVENTKEKEFYLMIQTELLQPTITGERLEDAASRLYDERSDAIEEKTDYLVVREWAGWSGGKA